MNSGVFRKKASDKMLFRKAEMCEAETVMGLYKAVIGTPFCPWNESYPGEIEIAEDLQAGTLYVLEEDREIIGAISIVPENEYDDFECWTVKENTREFARVVIGGISSIKAYPYTWWKALFGNFKSRELPRSI